MPPLQAKQVALDVSNFDKALSATEKTVQQAFDMLDEKVGLNNYTAAVDPTVNDDEDAEYTVGSRWYNVTDGQWWICSDASAGAAVWERILVQLTATVTTTTNALTPLATIPLPDDTAIQIEVHIVARRTDSPARAAYIRRACVYREAGGNVTLQGLVDSPFTRESPTASVWNATIVVSGTDLIIQVKGQTGHDVNWKCEYNLTQIG